MIWQKYLHYKYYLLDSKLSVASFKLNAKISLINTRHQISACFFHFISFFYFRHRLIPFLFQIFLCIDNVCNSIFVFKNDKTPPTNHTQKLKTYFCTHKSPLGTPDVFSFHQRGNNPYLQILLIKHKFHSAYTKSDRAFRRTYHRLNFNYIDSFKIVSWLILSSWAHLMSVCLWILGSTYRSQLLRYFPQI